MQLGESSIGLHPVWVLSFFRSNFTVVYSLTTQPNCCICLESVFYRLVQFISLFAKIFFYQVKESKENKQIYLDWGFRISSVSCLPGGYISVKVSVVALRRRQVSVLKIIFRLFGMHSSPLSA